ncbi:MAG TPA: ATP-binding cassette domain-containing protein [Steroidobacteraceae bacterium]|nr:ATP-binding cassette domain-containing protein [Steroidobacteraceae bacterium]
MEVTVASREKSGRVIRNMKSLPPEAVWAWRLVWRESQAFVRVRVWIIIGLVIGGGILSAASPIALKLVVDKLTGPLSNRVPIPAGLVCLYVLTLWLTRVANEFRGVVFAQVEQRIFSKLSERLFWHLIHLPLRFHADRRLGAVCQALDNGLQGLRIILRHLVLTYLPVIVELSAILIVLVRLVTAPFVILFSGAVVCYTMGFVYSAASLTRKARDASASRIESAAAMTDGLLNYETIKYFNAEELVQDRVARLLRRSESELVKFYKRYACNGLVVAGIFAAFLACTVFYAAEQVHRGRMTVGDFVLVSAYMLQVVRPVEMIGNAMQGILNGLGMLENLVQLFGEPMEQGLCCDARPVAERWVVEFQSVEAAYEDGRRILTDVSFTVPAGKTLGVVGASGSGKSTIVRLLMRLLEPEAGRILLGDVPISRMAVAELRRSIAVVPQDTMLFDETIRFNIALGRSGASVEEIERAARIAQLHDVVTTFANGYDTVVGERGVKLSGGERQRVAIARAVLKSPRIYVFDEATSSLDSPTEREILHCLREIARCNTTIVIAHRLSTVIHADEIIVLENRRIAERGTHSSLLRQNGAYAAMWKAQQEGAVAA